MRKTVRIIKSTKLHVDEEIYKEARNTVQKKKKAYFVEKLKESAAKPKSLWKIFKELSLPGKRLPCTDIYLKGKEELEFDRFPTSELFK